MKNYSLAEINSLIHRFEKRELPKVEWTHEAHLLVAIWYNFNYSAEEALDLVRDNITAHNTAVGTPNNDTDGYHESITVFWMLIAKQFLSKNSFHNVGDACNAFINSDYSASKFPLDYYSENYLFSVEARHHWVAPDIKEIVI